MRLVAALGALLLAAPFAHANPENDEYAWPDMSAFVRELVDRVGAPIRVYKVELDSDGNVDLWLQNRERPDLIDSYEYSDAKVNGPIPVKFEHYPSQDALEWHLIDLDRIDFARLPAMLARARKELRLPDAELKGIALERGDSSGLVTVSNVPIWTMRLGDPRHDGSVEFDLGGRVLSVDRD